MAPNRVLCNLQHQLCYRLQRSESVSVFSSSAAAASSSAAAQSAAAAAAPDWVLLTNDDGPPDAEHSPYIGVFAPYLALWAPQGRLAVCVPATQQSWRAKAHAPSEPLAVTGPDPASTGAPPLPQSDWVLVTGTPAAAANYGINHVGPRRFGKASAGGPLVVSGPNLGDNSGRSFMLSSGTLGAALEGALSGHRAVAVSFRRPARVGHAVTTGRKPQDPMDAEEAEQAEIASAAVCRLLTQLWSDWPASGIDLYNINVPLGALVAGEPCEAVYTTAAEDSYGSVFPDGGGSFAAEGRDASAAVAGSDVWALEKGLISVTPLQARFQEPGSFSSPVLGKV
jgi:tubulin--tyrosine ligase